jgi:hypothetical protein
MNVFRGRRKVKTLLLEREQPLLRTLDVGNMKKGLRYINLMVIDLY